MPTNCGFTMVVTHHQYFDFLIAKSSLELGIRLDPASEKLLEIVALHNFKGGNLTMMEALGLAGTLALSQSTLAKRIKFLHQMKLIEIIVNVVDRRIKTLCPSKETSSYFNLLSDQIANVNLSELDDSRCC